MHNDPPARPDDRPPRAGAPGALHATHSGAEDLQHVLKMIASSTDARRELVAELRSRVDSGDYVTEEKLNLAIYRLLKDILN